MDKLISLMMILAATSLTAAQGQLEVVVKNFKGGGGSVIVGLFNDERNFLKKTIRAKSVAVTSDIATVVFENLDAGEYAVSVIHDRNNNGKLDTNGLGIPTEGFAFGNNARGLFGPPAFEKASIVIKDRRSVQILQLRNL